jgi:ubiquinone biosynthesis protein
LLHNVQSQLEQVPHIAGMTRDLLERLSQPHARDPEPPWFRTRDGQALRLIGCVLLVGGAVLASRAVALDAIDAWPAWLMLVAGAYLVVRR